MLKKGCCIHLLDNRKYMKDYLNLNGSLSIYLGRKQNKKKRLPDLHPTIAFILCGKCNLII